MFHIHTTTTSSGNKAVQVVRYKNRKLIVIKHIGSAHNKDELQRLSQEAILWIEKANKQLSLFPQKVDSPGEQLQQYQYSGFRYGLLYESLNQLFRRFGFHWLRNKFLMDLVIAPIMDPGSKNKSIEFLKEFMGLEYGRRELYRQMSKILNSRSTVESKVLQLAKREFEFDFSLVFNDVTTLYFESSQEDELRQCGFSKDNKFNQPQIILGLLVNDKGFPLGYEIFEGKKFEGHTLIPVILRFKRKRKVEKLTVVADVAMISEENIMALENARLHYIVGARVAKLTQKQIEEACSKLFENDGLTIRMRTNYGDLICEFSQKRHAKDKREMEKQIARAEKLIKNPSSIKRSKFISSKAQGYSINKPLIDKTRLLLGIKGYYTNLSSSELSDQNIVEHYHNLWRVEHAFRISKSDLQIRPMYHFKEQTIRAHVLI